MNSQEIRQFFEEDTSSNSSVISIFHNLSDSDDPTVQECDLSDLSDSDISFDIDNELSNNAVGSETNASSNNSHRTVRSDINYIQWSDVTGNLNNFAFNPAKQPYIDNTLQRELQDASILDFYSIFVDDEVLDMLVLETNRHAEQSIVKAILSNTTSPHSKLVNWVDTTRNEILMFLGLVMWMGLDSKPKLRDYWTKSPLYTNPISKLMSRNRFETILSLFHCADNEAPSPERLYKINPLINLLNTKFQKTYNPDENICIDESMIPFRGRVLFRQYIPGKRHKYGLKIFKLCLKGGYTWSLKLYGGKETNSGEIPISSKIVMELMQPLLGEGRTLHTDNYYTSVDLAHRLNEKQTHLVGTLRGRRKHNPDRVVKQKLRKGDMVAKESNTKVIVGKWKDKRDVIFLTTKSVPEMVEVQTRRGSIQKPSTIVQYNAAKSFIDISDQMASYGSPIRRSVKWYRKVMFELLTNTAVVNAHAVHKRISTTPMDIIKFREELTLQILFRKTQEEDSSVSQTNLLSHSLTELSKRGRCTSCYTRLSEEFGRAHALRKTPQVRMNCPGCLDYKFLCMNCFFKIHNCSVKK
jgi:hypothetical protein